MQSKKHSLIETITNTLIGFITSLLAQLVVYDYYNINLSINQNINITIFFTVISIARGYGVRRLFNYFEKWKTTTK